MTPLDPRKWTPRDLACASMWTERPLVKMFVRQTGRENFTLKELIAFAEALPWRTFQMMRGEPSQGSPHVAAPTRRPSQQARTTGSI